MHLEDKEIPNKLAKHYWGSEFMKVLYVSDLDGTLLNDDQEMSIESIEILNELIAKGVHFTIATARLITSTKEILDSIPFRLPVILVNGVFIYDTESCKNVIGHYLSAEMADKIIQTYIKQELNPFVYTMDMQGEPHIYYGGAFNESEKNYINNRLLKSDPRFKVVSSYLDCLQESIISVNAIDSPDKLIDTYRAFEHEESCIRHFGPDVYTPGYHWLEISNSRATKKDAIQYIKDLYGFNRVVCFGDNLNDLSMFEIADECYAVNNAHELVLNAADKIIESNNNNGVVRFIKEHFLSNSTLNTIQKML